MIRRKSKRSGADANQAAPANPTSVSSAPPAGSVPAGGDEASPVVIDELMAAFGVGSAGRGPTKPVDPAVPEGGKPGGTAPEPAAPPSTRAMSPTEIVTHIETAPSPEPASPPDLVPEPTRRSARRSRKEAKREAKREKKRLAEHNKAQKKARKQTRRARRKARRQGDGEGSRSVDRSAESDVRIITPDDPSVPPVISAPPPAPTASGPPATGSTDGPTGGSGGPTIQIAGDELPDAVHIEGDLGAGDKGGVGTGSAGRSTVFIDEDPSHADVVTMDVATSAARMEPRIRERRIAVKRAVGRRRLRWVGLVVAVLLVAVAAFAVLGSGLFKITTVSVDGRVYSGGPAFDAVVEDLDGANVLRVDTDAAERDLERIPWVEEARVTTDFPNGAIIEVREREPSIAYQGADGRYRVLDREGRVLDVIPGQPVAYLELFVTDAADLDPGQPAPKGYRAAARLVQALTPQMRARVVSVSADADATDLRMMLDNPAGGGDIEVRFGAAEELVDKLVRLQTALTDPDPEQAPTEIIDVSGPDIIIR